MLSVLAAYIDNNNDGCPDNPPDFLKNILKSTIPADEAGIGAVILTKKQSFQMPAGFQAYYGLTMWEAETRPECSGTQASDTCRDASLEEVFHLLTDKGYGPTWPAALGLYSTSNSSLTRAMDKARNPPSGSSFILQTLKHNNTKKDNNNTTQIIDKNNYNPHKIRRNLIECHKDIFSWKASLSS